MTADSHNYILGYLLSVTLTLLAPVFLLVHEVTGHSLFAHTTLRVAFLALALVQLVVQLVFFLHIRGEKRPRWRFMTLVSTVLIVVIVVGGSLWIMENLDARMGSMSPDAMDAYMLDQE
ncbi:MAG TPA: cytochrome o ubiquinol oxidase subunit IV [Candidatus Paceibacterota bacterium]|nr:cytochrome o ubiquinol oxidase subunit IV [Candidatus Paceibacterota bacterium]